jgi:hypothetical protein
VLQPEYGTVRTATALFGIPRTELFRLIAQDKIHSIHYRKEGARKGVRLIDFGSVRAYLEVFATTGGRSIDRAPASRPSLPQTGQAERKQKPQPLYGTKAQISEPG